MIQILATPVLGMTLLLVAVEHAFGWGIFDPARGGDPVLFQHFFWFYSHPAVYIMVLPAMAVISEVVCAYSHKNMFGYKAIAYSSLGIAFVGFFTWGHHLFTSGQSPWDAGIFGVLSMFVGIFTAIKVFNWTATLYKGSISFKTPFAYFIGFLFFLVFGGMTGIALATVSLDVHWQDTYFVVAHFHFIMVGAVDHGVPRRAPLLVPEDDRADVPGGLGARRRGPRHPRVQRHLHPAVPARQRGHAAPLLLVPGAVLAAERRLHRRRLASSRSGSSSSSSTCSSRLKWGPVASDEPVGLAGLRVGHRLPAPARELRETTPVFTAPPHDYDEGAEPPPHAPPEPSHVR